MLLIATDLPDPVVPATSRWGMRARSATTGLPPISLPSARARLASVFSKLALASSSRNSTVSRSPLGSSMPMTLRPRDCRGANRNRAHRARDVVGEPDYPRGSRAGLRFELVERDYRPGPDLGDLAEDPEILENGDQHLRVSAAALPRSPFVRRRRHPHRPAARTPAICIPHCLPDRGRADAPSVPACRVSPCAGVSRRCWAPAAAPRLRPAPAAAGSALAGARDPPSPPSVRCDAAGFRGQVSRHPRRALHARRARRTCRKPSGQPTQRRAASAAGPSRRCASARAIPATAPRVLSPTQG